MIVISIILAAILLLIQNSVMAATLGLFLIGLGNGPIFPNTTHLTLGLYSKNRNEYAGRPYVRSGFYVTENYCVMPTAEKPEK